jgi:hypothetical protein
MAKAVFELADIQQMGFKVIQLIIGWLALSYLFYFPAGC